MKLKEFLKERSTSLMRWCKDNNLPYFSVRNIVKGGDCYLSTAVQIEKATNGLVRCEDLIPEKKKKYLVRLEKIAKNEDQQKNESQNEAADHPRN